MINQAIENMGLQQTQMFATLFGGVARHSAAGVWFKKRSEEVGFEQAVQERDSGDPIAAEAKPHPVQVLRRRSEEMRRWH